MCHMNSRDEGFITSDIPEVNEEAAEIHPNTIMADINQEEICLEFITQSLPENTPIESTSPRQSPLNDTVPCSTNQLESESFDPSILPYQNQESHSMDDHSLVTSPTSSGKQNVSITNSISFAFPTAMKNLNSCSHS